MLLLLDIGNTHTHLGLANDRTVSKQTDIPTQSWREGTAIRRVRSFAGKSQLQAVAACSVVPSATAIARREFKKMSAAPWFELTARTAAAAIGIDYPRPDTIGPDRLANAIAARHQLGDPCLAIDFGTAVTFDVVDRKGRFIGGVIAPGLALLTGYLHEKTALLPEIKIRPARTAIGRSTEEAMRAGAVYGFRGMVRELIMQIGKELRSPQLPVVATGGYARLVASALPEITAVNPFLTLEGLQLAWKVGFY